MASITTAPQTRADRGLTLIEALVSITFFAVIAAAVFSLLMMSVSSQRANSLAAHANAVAVKELEDLRALRYSALVTHDTVVPSFEGTPFTVHSDVANDTPAANTKTVTVTVSWSDHGRARSYTMKTVYTCFNTTNC